MKKEKEDDSWKKSLRNQITKIKSEGKARENKINERYNKAFDNSVEANRKLDLIVKNADKKQISSPKEYSKYKREIESAHFDVKEAQANVRKERGSTARKVGIIGSKIESGVHRALESATSRLGQALKQRVISRKILKPNKMEVHIKERVPESNWTDKNIFFKDNYQKEKRSMFLE